MDVDTGHAGPQLELMIRWKEKYKVLWTLWQEGMICLEEQVSLPWWGPFAMSWVMKDEKSAKDMEDGR